MVSLINATSPTNPNGIKCKFNQKSFSTWIIVCTIFVICQPTDEAVLKNEFVSTPVLPFFGISWRILPAFRTFASVWVQDTVTRKTIRIWYNGRCQLFQGVAILDKKVAKKAGASRNLANSGRRWARLSLCDLPGYEKSPATLDGIVRAWHSE